MSRATLEITGPEAEAIAAELTAWWKSASGEELQLQAERQKPTDDTRGDPWAILAVVLAVPGFLLASVDLAKRAELREKVSRLIAWAREKRKEHPKLRIEVVAEDGRSVDVATAEPADVLEVLVLKSRKPREEETSTPPAPKGR